MCDVDFLKNWINFRQMPLKTLYQWLIYMVQLETPQMKTAITKKIDLYILVQNLPQLFSRFLSTIFTIISNTIYFCRTGKNWKLVFVGKGIFSEAPTARPTYAALWQSKVSADLYSALSWLIS